MTGKEGDLAKARARQLIEEVINRGRVDLLDQLFSPELVPPIRSAFAAFRSAFPDWQEEIVELVAEQDTLVMRLRCSGTFVGDFQGFAPNGRRQEVDEVFFLRLRGTRFTEYWGIEDRLTRMQQLGLTYPAHQATDVVSQDGSALESGPGDGGEPRLRSH